MKPRFIKGSPILLLDYSLWELEKCQKFIDGVIFNMELLLKDEFPKTLDN